MLRRITILSLLILLLTISGVYAVGEAQIKEIEYDLNLGNYSIVNVVKNGDYLYGADAVNGLRIFELKSDILTDITPSDEGTYLGTFSSNYKTDLLAIDNGYLYAAFYSSSTADGAVQGIRKYDLSNPKEPQLVDYVKVTSMYIYGICIYDELIMAAGPSEFLIYDKELTKCIKRSDLNMPSVIDGRKVYAHDGYLYYSCATTVAEGRNRIVEVYDISELCGDIDDRGAFLGNSAYLKYLSTVNISLLIGEGENISVLHSIGVYNKKLYVVGERGLVILNAEDKEKIELIKYYDRAELPGIDASNNYLRSFNIEDGIGYLSWYYGVVSYKLDGTEVKEHKKCALTTKDTTYMFVSGREIYRATRVSNAPIEVCIFPECHGGNDDINKVSFKFEDGGVRSKFSGCISKKPKWLITALYKDKRLIDCKVTLLELKNTIHETVIESELLKLPEIDEYDLNDYTLKAFVWDYNIKPLANATEFKPDCIEIFEYTENALPGNAIGIHGSGFCEGASVVLESVETAGDIKVLNREIEVLTVSDVYVGAMLPEDIPEGIYNLRVKNGIFADDEIIRVNLPDAWQVMNLAGTEVSPGTKFAVYGNNLDFKTGTPRAKFVSLNDDKEYVANVENNDDKFEISISAPDNLKVGDEYSIYINNGFGNEYVKGPSVSCIESSTDKWNLGVPWTKTFDDIYDKIFDVTDKKYGALSDGSRDATKAIQTAIDDAFEAGGGVVYLPEGTYDLSGNTIYLKPKVVLKGDGADKTMLTTLSVPKEQTYKMIILSDTDGYMGITGVHIVCPSGTYKIPVSTNRNKYLFITNCIVENYDEYTANCLAIDLCSNVLIKNNSFINHGKRNRSSFMTLTNNTDVWFTNNHTEHRTHRLVMDNSVRIQCDNNDMWRHTDADYNYLVEQQEETGEYPASGFFRLWNTSDTIIKNNTAGKIGEGSVFHRADGEFILYESQSHGIYNSYGTVTAADTYELYDTSGKNSAIWSQGVALNGEYIIKIVSGKGMGQVRKVVSFTPTSVTVDKPWDTVPDKTSNYAISFKNGSNLMWRGNTINNQPDGISLYNATVENAIIEGNTYNNSTTLGIRNIQRALDNMFSISRNVLIENNKMWNTTNEYASQIFITTVLLGDEELHGSGFVNTVVRNNVVQAFELGNNNKGRPAYKQRIGEGYFCNISPEKGTFNDAIGTTGVIFDSNRAINCDKVLYVNSGSYQTIFVNTQTENCGVMILDDSLEEFGGSHGSYDTVQKNNQ